MLTIRKHLTLRNTDSDIITEEGIDATIDRGLRLWQEKPLVEAVRLVSALPIFRSDGELFVTMILDVEVEDV